MRDEKLKVGDRVRCADTREAGRVVSFRNGLPVVEFECGATGSCTAAQRLK